MPISPPPYQGASNGSSASQAAPAAPAQAMVRGFRILARRTSPPEQLMQSFSPLSFLKMATDASDPQTLLVLNVESRDISNNPYVFSIFYFRPNAIDALYTIPPNGSPKLRRLEMVKLLFNLLTLSSEQHAVDMRHLYQFLESTLEDMNEYVSGDYQKLYSQFDSLQSETGALKKKAKDFASANAALTKDNYELKNRLDEVTLRLQGLGRYSDDVLAVKIQSWLAEHSGEINLSDFARVHGVSEARVEQVLNQLVSAGYLETRK
ncbi:MAG: hypothetical protein M1530_03090 [Candidatus Marsarchaeota archaeon]|nr:hypothetical protein [Candidatus Marsarchaeota archaeon]